MTETRELADKKSGEVGTRAKQRYDRYDCAKFDIAAWW